MITLYTPQIPIKKILLFFSPYIKKMLSLSGREISTRNFRKNLSDLGCNVPFETFSSLSSYFNIKSTNTIFLGH